MTNKTKLPLEISVNGKPYTKDHSEFNEVVRRGIVAVQRRRNEYWLNRGKDMARTTNNGVDGYSSDHHAPATAPLGPPRSDPATTIRSMAQNLTANIQMEMDMHPDMMSRIYKLVFTALQEAQYVKE